MNKNSSLKAVSAVLLLFVFAWQALAQESQTPEASMAAAIRGCNLTTVKNLLVSNPALVNAKLPPGGDPPLEFAITFDCKDIFELLLAKGANVNARNNAGQTPLVNALYPSKKAYAELLLKNGADVNAKDDSGDAPLHYAAMDGDAETVQFLLKNGADVNAKSDSGTTALDAAKEYRQRKGGTKYDQVIAALMKGASPVASAPANARNANQGQSNDAGTTSRPQDKPQQTAIQRPIGIQVSPVKKAEPITDELVKKWLAGEIMSMSAAHLVGDGLHLTKPRELSEVHGVYTVPSELKVINLDQTSSDTNTHVNVLDERMTDKGRLITMNTNESFLIPKGQQVSVVMYTPRVARLEEIKPLLDAQDSRVAELIAPYQEIEKGKTPLDKQMLYLLLVSLEAALDSDRIAMEHPSDERFITKNKESWELFAGTMRERVESPYIAPSGVPHFLLGFANFKLGKYAEALEVYRQVLSLKPNFAATYFNMGITYIQLKRYDEALEHLKKAGQLNPEYTEWGAYKMLLSALRP